VVAVPAVTPVPAVVSLVPSVIAVVSGVRVVAGTVVRRGGEGVLDPRSGHRLAVGQALPVGGGAAVPSWVALVLGHGWRTSFLGCWGNERIDVLSVRAGPRPA
jgi:hypothetical protein